MPQCVIACQWQNAEACRSATHGRQSVPRSISMRANYGTYIGTVPTSAMGWPSTREPHCAARAHSIGYPPIPKYDRIFESPHTILAKRKLLARVRRIRGQVEAIERALEAEVRLRDRDAPNRWSTRIGLGSNG